MDAPKISIITPSFNQVAYLEDTINSVLGQQYPNLEYIIIDGGSTDGSVEIIKKYENQLAYWESTADKGMYYAIQKGFEKSTGEIMAWLNSDDMYHRKALFTVAEIFSSFQSVNWLQGTVSFFDETGRTVKIQKAKTFTRFDFYNHNYRFIQQESCFWRRSLWLKTGATLNCNLKYAGDFALWLKFFSTEKLYVTNTLIGGFRLRKNNQLSLEHFKEYIEECEKELANVYLNKTDKFNLFKFKMFNYFIKFIKCLKIFRTDWMLKYYQKRYLNSPEEIVFDRFSQKFEIKAK